MATFTSVEDSSRKIHVQVARQIARRILSGGLQPLEKLPCELEMCDIFGVSRTSLRESIKLLSAKGLIESKPRVGTRVQERNNWHFLDPQLMEWIQDLEDNQRFLAQFLGLRKAIEPEACALAAKHASVAQRKDLSIVFQRMTFAAQSHNMAQWTENDHLFHQLIFQSTGNQFFLPFSNILSTIFREFIDESAEGGRFCLAEHQRIYDAIMAGKSDAARLASQTLLNDENQRLAQVV